MYHILVKTFFLFTLVLAVCFAVNFEFAHYVNKKDVFGSAFNFKSIQGNVVLIVNIPFDCKFADPIYDDLRYVHKELNKKGAFSILFFISDQFSGSTSSCDENQIRKQKNKLSRLPFKIFKAQKITGPHAHPLFKFLIKESHVKPDRDFYKYLIDHQGNVAEVFRPNQTVIGEPCSTMTSYMKKSMGGIFGNLGDLLKELGVGEQNP